jgi:putative protein kinase ArgK-like GTPase of G3E family
MEEPNKDISIEQMFERLWADIRLHRNQMLELADIKINKLEDAGQDASSWRTYRQALRDLPGQFEHPTQVVWPAQPQ